MLPQYIYRRQSCLVDARGCIHGTGMHHNRSHCKIIGEQVSDSLRVTANIVQGSVLGPPSFLVTASDLQPLSSSNVIVKYAHDMYVIISTSNHSTCNSEIQHVEGRADKHNLKLNYNQEI